MEKQFKIIAGLGNPGQKYQNTYHNIGYMALELLSGKLAEKLNIPVNAWQEKKARRFAVLQTPSIKLVRSLDFMNASGAGIKNALSYFKISPEQLLVMHDDVDIPAGSTKLNYARGAAGHKGVTSIINTIDTKDFWRLRIGIGANNQGKAREKVLKTIPKKEQKEIYSALNEAIENVIENI